MLWDSQLHSKIILEIGTLSSWPNLRNSEKIGDLRNFVKVGSWMLGVSRFQIKFYQDGIYEWV